MKTKFITVGPGLGLTGALMAQSRRPLTARCRKNTMFQNEGALYGSFNYAPDKDHSGANDLERLPFRVEQFEWMFLDVTDKKGRIAVASDRGIASVIIEVGNWEHFQYARKKHLEFSK